MKLNNLVRANRHPILILLVIVSAVGIVFMLASAALSPMLKTTGFNRTFISQSLKLVTATTRDDMISGISGITRNEIFFRTTRPDRLYCTDKLLKNGHYLKIDLPNEDKIGSAYQTIVDSPFIYILAGNLPGVVVTTLNKTKSQTYMFPKSWFTRGAIINSNTCVIRGLDSTKKDQVFSKHNFQSGSITFEKNIVGRNGDLGISTDGMLHFDKDNSYLVYVQFFKNEFMVIDTNLSLIYKSKTLGQFTSEILAERVQSAITNSKPSFAVNAKSFVADNKLFNISRIKSDNETLDVFLANDVVDVYELKRGKYIGSFYLPKYQTERAASIRVDGDNLYMVYKSKILKYKISHTVI